MKVLSEVLGYPVRYQQVAPGAFKATLVQNGISEAWAQGLADMAAQVEEGIYNAEPRTPQSTTPTTFRQWCEEVLKPTLQE